MPTGPISRRAIKPLLDDPLIEFIGEIGDAEKPAFLGGARALLFPIDWPEPFGLVMIEAMAAGTPVIAWRCGSTGEVIEHGRSGFLVDSVDEAVAAVAAGGSIAARRRPRRVRATLHRRAHGARLCPAVRAADRRKRPALFGKI